LPRCPATIFAFGRAGSSLLGSCPPDQISHCPERDVSMNLRLMTIAVHEGTEKRLFLMVSPLKQCQIHLPRILAVYSVVFCVIDFFLVSRFMSALFVLVEDNPCHASLLQDARSLGPSIGVGPFSRQFSSRRSTHSLITPGCVVRLVVNNIAAAFTRPLPLCR